MKWLVEIQFPLKIIEVRSGLMMICHGARHQTETQCENAVEEQGFYRLEE